jgi:hypothetical protein
MILYLKDSKNFTQKLLDTINCYSKVAEYKINLQKSKSFLYTNNEQAEKGYMETMPFTIPSKQIKYLGVNLTKDVNELYKENYNLLKKEIEEDYRRWTDLPCSWIGRINIVKWLYYQKQSTCLCNSHQNPNDFHHRDQKIYPKVHLEAQGTANSQGNTQQEKQC